jgi:hypothetical protein
MASLPQKLSWDLAQTRWANMINPTINFPPIQGTLLTNVNLINGVTVINHLLGRNQQGWILTDQTAAANIYRSAPFNSLTLSLTSDASTTVNIWCY